MFFSRIMFHNGDKKKNLVQIDIEIIANGRHKANIFLTSAFSETQTIDCLTADTAAMQEDLSWTGSVTINHNNREK